MAQQTLTSEAHIEDVARKISATSFRIRFEKTSPQHMNKIHSPLKLQEFTRQSNGCVLRRSSWATFPEGNCCTTTRIHSFTRNSRRSRSYKHVSYAGKNTHNHADKIKLRNTQAMERLLKKWSRRPPIGLTANTALLQPYGGLRSHSRQNWKPSTCYIIDAIQDTELLKRSSNNSDQMQAISTEIGAAHRTLTRRCQLKPRLTKSIQM